MRMRKGADRSVNIDVCNTQFVYCTFGHIVRKNK